MAQVEVTCNYCKTKYLKECGRFNEAVKFGWHHYCSRKCLGKSKNCQINLKCSRLGCNKTFFRLRKDLKKSTNVYCSQSCAAIVNNSKFIKRTAVIKECDYCGKKFKMNKKFCTRNCKDLNETISKTEISNWINDFYVREGRIPFKNECPHTKAARRRFGTWNEAIKASGYKPNPVMFAKKYLANDGHKCDSLAEKIIDDWLFKRNISHKRAVPYPQDKKLTADFVINEYWIEFFGLAGKHKIYDKLMQRKLDLAKKNHLNFIQILPNDLFPKNKLKAIFAPIYVK